MAGGRLDLPRPRTADLALSFHRDLVAWWRAYVKSAEGSHDLIKRLDKLASRSGTR